MENSEKNVICVLVLYRPDKDLLREVVGAVYGQVDKMLISDNTPGCEGNTDEFLPLNKDKIVYHSIGENVGIAKAQNVGIQYAINNGYDYVFFLDQDSICPEGIVGNLISRFSELENIGLKVGGIGPAILNRDTGKVYKANIMRGKRVIESIKERQEIISSASLMLTRLFKDVGLMDEYLFIDAVDHELCWRANHLAGYRFFVDENVALSHKLGEGDRNFLGITVKVPTPFRSYFLYRNYIVLLFRKYVPIYWKVSNGIKYIGKYFYYPLMCSPRLEYLKNINKGIYDGVHKILGVIFP